ncbi:MAG: alpha/beta fold hydrolase [Proteobacteria bacterium]|nr:alpha/beta fold hydrolase [Pseudomonadota bacterium]
MTALPAEFVVILHGMGGASWTMFPLELYLRRRSFQTINITYPSRRGDLRAQAELVHSRLKIADVWNRSAKVHFVGHSMGGLVARTYLDKYKAQIPQEKMGRVVLAAPPNGGSEIADLLAHLVPYQLYFGPAGQELTTTSQAQSPTPYYELGIIAGTVGWPYPVASFFFDGAHDGRVAVERTKLPGMKDHIALKATHSLIAWKRDVLKQIAAFIRDGAFERSPPTSFV